jgi:hypothetical protein
MPDADVTSAVPEAAVEIDPCRPVFLIFGSCVGFQVLEGAPVLNNDFAKTVVPQESGFGMSFEFLQHFRHGKKNSKPFVQLPGLIHSHANEKYNELAVHLGRHPGIYHLRHGISSSLEHARWVFPAHHNLPTGLDSTGLPPANSSRSRNIGGQLPGQGHTKIVLVTRMVLIEPYRCAPVELMLQSRNEDLNNPIN